jgi:hypothetical protein
MLAEGRPVAYIEAVGRGKDQKVRVTIGRSKPRRTLYIAPSEFVTIAEFARSIGHADGQWLERYATERTMAVQARAEARETERAAAKAEVRKREIKMAKRSAKAARRKPKRHRKPEPPSVVRERSPTWPWKPQAPARIEVDEFSGDIYAAGRDPMPDSNDDAEHDWLWSNSVPVFHSHQDLPAEVRRVLDDHEWLDRPLHGDGGHAFRVHNELKAEAARARKSMLPNDDRNGARNPNARLTEAEVVRIHEERGMGRTIAAIASDLGISASAVHDVCVGRTWKHMMPKPASVE